MHVEKENGICYGAYCKIDELMHTVVQQRSRFSIIKKKKKKEEEEEGEKKMKVNSMSIEEACESPILSIISLVIERS